MKNVPDHAAGTGASPSGKQEFIFGLLLALAVFIAYQPVWHAGFIWDDDAHLTKNPCITGALGFKGIWASSEAVYYPLVLTSFWVQHALWGLNALPFHLVNVAMHAACAILLWRVLLGLKVRGAWLGAALWALHPVQVESAAWITELKNTQSCFFYLLAIWLFLKWRVGTIAPGKANEWNFAGVLLCAILAILSKTSTVMLPVVLGLCWWWLDRCWRWQNLLRLLPVFLISAAASGWTIWEQKYHSGALGVDWAQSWPERFVIAGKVVWFYLAKLAWPHPLIFIYPRWVPDASWWVYYLPLISSGLILFAFWWYRDQRLRPSFFAFSYFVVSLFPVLGFFSVFFFRYSFVGDHLQYLASMGPLAFAAAGIVWLVDRLQKNLPWLKAATGAGLVLALGTLSWQQAGIYRSPETLWNDTLQKNPACWMACDNLGNELFQQGQTDAAIAQYQKALAIKPDDEVAYDDLASVYLQQGHTDEAIAAYQRALQIKPNSTDTMNNLGNALLQKGDVDAAMTLFNQVLQLKPGHPKAINNLGNALFQKGNLDEAMARYEQALKIDPGYAQADYNLGVALMQKGDVDGAITHYRKALQNRPDYADAMNNLGNALLQKGEVEAAIGQYQKVLQIQPDYLEARNNLAWILATVSQASLRNGAQAVALAERANQLSGGENPVVLRTLAAGYAEAGRYDDAQQSAQKSLGLSRAAGQTDLAEQIQGELKLYAAGRPFHQDSK